MILSAIRNGEIALAIYILISVLISLAVHEYSHGFAAYKCGDRTAYNFGRLTLNPIRHIDIFGFLALLIVGFGWAKPVPVNMRNLKKPRRDIALVSLAGPVSNFLLAFIGVFFYRLFRTFAFSVSPGGFFYGVAINFITFFFYFTLLNLGLGLFNLIPIPPLDGSKILTSLLPRKAAYAFIQLERYAGILILALFLLANTGAADFIFGPLETVRGWIFNQYNSFFSLFPFFR